MKLCKNKSRKAAVVLGWFFSILIHATVAGGLLVYAPQMMEKRHDTPVQMALKKPKPVPVQVKETKTEQVPEIEKKPKTIAPKKLVEAPPPPSNSARPEKQVNKEVKPVFGISMNSVVTGGGAGVAMAVQVGNTLLTDPKKSDEKPEEVVPYNGSRKIKSQLADEFQPVYKLTEMPAPEKLVRAVYPEEMRVKGIEGVVKLKLWIDTDGNVTKAAIAESLNKILDRLAVEAALKFKFSPARMNGEPVATVIPFLYKWEIVN